ncbi:PIG-L deacetylase family protein [cf. Phormidesmis sp. LEGE 11477]|uniref:PIG-L deacetylase family protein n=1 Tax=cf. Phormidesmis sp. LEGE 11477 TaxID=1828680 RepID=UPI00188017B4|nr:PIG-L family deacetylase [cf. Phormidesmis sp. LEGE 11477]MBE9060881.1 PIG-L family deacetylase [cf. Phormidesmis sp. LEGE 11477]
MVLATALPVKTIDALLEEYSPVRRVVVVAPHPDDETLGCGGAIAHFCQHGIPVQVMIMSDGTQSHPNSKRFPAEALRQIRELETGEALKLLGTENMTFFRWPDTAVPSLGESLGQQERFAKAVQRCDRYFRAYLPDLVFLPWQYDRHCDHRATWQIVRYCLKSWAQPPRQLAYSIWGDDTAGLASLPAGETGWRLDIRSVENLKRQAAFAHRSQTTGLIDDDPAGFRLTAEMLNNLIQPYETYLEVK